MTFSSGEEQVASAEPRGAGWGVTPVLGGPLSDRQKGGGGCSLATGWHHTAEKAVGPQENKGLPDKTFTLEGAGLKVGGLLPEEGGFLK